MSARCCRPAVRFLTMIDISFRLYGHLPADHWRRDGPRLGPMRGSCSMPIRTWQFLPRCRSSQLSRSSRPRRSRPRTERERADVPDPGAHRTRLLLQAHAAAVRTGLPGIAYLRARSERQDGRRGCNGPSHHETGMSGQSPVSAHVSHRYGTTLRARCGHPHYPEQNVRSGR